MKAPFFLTLSLILLTPASALANDIHQTHPEVYVDDESVDEIDPECLSNSISPHVVIEFQNRGPWRYIATRKLCINNEGESAIHVKFKRETYVAHFYVRGRRIDDTQWNIEVTRQDTVRGVNYGEAKTSSFELPKGVGVWSQFYGYYGSDARNLRFRFKY